MTPKRIQRRRTKNWKMPVGTISVTRPGRWGNPFSVVPNFRPGSICGGAHGYRSVPTVEDAIECFKEFVKTAPGYVEAARRELRGHDLACFCKVGDPCHGDYLLEIANSPEPKP